MKELGTVGLAVGLAPILGLTPRLLFLLLPLLLLYVALFHLLGLLLVALFDLLPSCVIGILLGEALAVLLLPSCVIGILLGEALVVLLLSLHELLMFLFLFPVELVLLLLVFLILPGIARLRRSRPIVRRNVPGVTERRTIVSRIWRTVAVVSLV
jgi:hypothetical protein